MNHKIPGNPVNHYFYWPFQRNRLERFNTLKPVITVWARLTQLLVVHYPGAPMSRRLRLGGLGLCL